MTSETSAIALDQEVRAVWAAARDAQRLGHTSTVAVTGPNAARAAQALAAISGDQTVVYSASGIRSRKDWYSIEVATASEGMPDGTEVTSRGTYRVPTALAHALTQPGPRVVVIVDFDAVPADAAVGLRGALDADGTTIPLRGRTSPDVQVIIASEKLPTHVRNDLDGRVHFFIDLQGSVVES